MSAFDIAGAIVWTPLAALMWAGTIGVHRKNDELARLIGFCLSIVITLAAVFCIARLSGATL